MHVKSDWPVSLSVSAADGQTCVEACLVMPGGGRLVGHGQARRHPADRLDVRIGAEIATARAISDLAWQLWQVAAAAIEDNTREQALLYP